jgi:hypothetical protein
VRAHFALDTLSVGALIMWRLGNFHNHIALPRRVQVMSNLMKLLSIVKLKLTRSARDGGRDSFQGAIVLLALVLFNSVSIQAETHSNVAFIIANSHYDENEWGELPNTINDARLIARKMKAAGFQIDDPPAVDLPIDQLRARLLKFTLKVETLPSDTIVWIYYAGHGMQVYGTNYIIPIGAPAARTVVPHIDDIAKAEHELAKAYISLNELLVAFGEHRRAPSADDANVLILDACRDNPWERSGQHRPRGLAETPQAANALIAYSASPGTTADDGPKNGNSPYAIAFANSLSEGYLPLELVFNRVTSEVIRLTERHQRPDYHVGLSGFYCIAQCSLVQAVEDVGRDNSKASNDSTERGVQSCVICINEQVIQLNNKRQLWVSQTVIPLGLWKKCVEVLACPERQDSQGETEHSAATGISWSEVAKFLLWLNNTTGKSYRLPTSDEWAEIYKQGHPGGGSKASATELPQDAHSDILVDEGVSEMTSSCDSGSSASPCTYRLVRGASWEDSSGTDPLRIDAFPVDAKGTALGFRVVRDH